MFARKGPEMKSIRKQLHIKLWNWDAVFGAFLIIQFLLWGWLNFHYQYVNDHDSAKVLYHTIRMWEEKTLLIPGWKYMTTAEWDCSALPALLFYGITGDVLLSFAITNVIHVLCFSLIVCKLFDHLGLRGKYAYLAISVILIPFELGMLSYANMLFYGAAQYIYKTLLPLWMLELLTAPEGSWKKAGWFLQLPVFCALTFLTAVSSGLYVFLSGLFPIMLCSALFILRSEQFKAHLPKIAVCILAFLSTLCGYVLQKMLGLSTYADEMNVVLLDDFFAQLANNLLNLLSLARALPSKTTSLYSLGGMMYLVRFAFLVCVLFLGLKALKGWFSDSSEMHPEDRLPVYAGAALSSVFAWNLFIQQMTITTARYHLIGYVPLMLAACITFAIGTQRRSAFLQFIRFACASGMLAILMFGCWNSAFSFAGNYHKDYHEAVTDLAQAHDAGSIAFINDSAAAEMARVFDRDRVYVSYFTSNRSLVNYDAHDYYDDRSAMTDRHLLVATFMGGLSDLPYYLQSSYTKIGEVFGDAVYLSENCQLDGTAGPIPNRTAVDYPFTQGYTFDTSIDDHCLFPKGEERIALKSPTFRSQPSAVIVTLHYQLEGSDRSAWLDVNVSAEAPRHIDLLQGTQQTSFEIPAGKTFSFCAGLGKDAALQVNKITFDWR